MKISGWNAIYTDPADYTYYDLEKPHEDLDQVIEIFRTNQVKTILDVGCGMGRNLIPLVMSGFSLTGIDSAPEGIKKNKQLLEEKHLNADLAVGAFQHLPFPPTSFDAVICVQTLNHGFEKDVQQGVAQIQRVLKPGGMLFLTVPGRISQGKVRQLLIKTAKQIEANTYIPASGKEAGIPHHVFSKRLIYQYLKEFRIEKIWKDERDYYCCLARLKN